MTSKSLIPTLVAFVLLNLSCARKERLRPDPNSFVITTLFTGMDEPMELEVMPDGGVLFIERSGKIRKYDPRQKTARTVGEIKVLLELENGLLGLAMDPKFSDNNWIYLFYTSPDTLAPRQHVSRFSLVEDSLVLSSEKVLLTIPIDRDICCHSAGCLEFGPAGNLYISTGDNTNPSEFGQIDERPGQRHADSQRTAANTLDLRGKILRIKPQPDGTYAIPEGNLFKQHNALARSEIYVMGNRNPFRMSIDPVNGTLFWGDMGPNPYGGKDSVRGPKSHEEINRADEAGNFGWPYLLADNQPYRDYNYELDEMGDFFDHGGLINNSPNNTGLQELPPARSAFLWYPNTPSERWPEVGSGGGSIMSGPVYRKDGYPESGQKLPEYFDGKLFIFDWMRGWILTATIDDDAGPMLETFLPRESFRRPIDLTIGPDGALYVLDYGSHWHLQNTDSKLARITYNPQPAMTAGSAAEASRLDLSIQFESNKSFYYPNRNYQYQIKRSGQQTGVTRVSLHFFPDSDDPNAPGFQEELKNSLTPSVGRTLIESSDCQGCHLDRGFSIGPSFAQISTRYKNRPDSVVGLPQKILSGGGGVWGDFNMPPHPQHNVEEAGEMVEYILSVSENRNTQRILPLAGSFSTPAGIGHGLYVLSASVFDPAQETELNSLVLRHPLVPAHSCDSLKDAGFTAQDEEGRKRVQFEQNGAFVSFRNIDLTGIDSLFFHLGSRATGLRLETRINSSQGPIIGVLEDDPSDGGRNNRVTKMSIDDTPGRHDLYFVVGPADRVVEGDVVLLESIYFHSTGEGASYTQSAVGSTN